jgi:nucleoside-diphosphate-sugar epimerase
MKILVTGNLGYVGSVLIPHLRKNFNESEIIGLDIGLFSSSLVNDDPLPETLLDNQIFKDVRDIQLNDLEGIDAVVHLAAISNDPMGSTYAELTDLINFQCSVDVAKKAKEAGVKSFTFASSCSVYGLADTNSKTEMDQVNPLTAYAKSKIDTENEIKYLASDDFKVTSLRFATACGASPRLRLDLVLNDFVASAVKDKKIDILSDGTPWRPLIHVKDMARAIEWSILRKPFIDNNLIVNVGSDHWNYQVSELAEAVNKAFPSINVNINLDAAPDKRSYKVDFSKYMELAPDHQPLMSLEESIESLKKQISTSNYIPSGFRESRYIRLNHLNFLKSNNLISESLKIIK